MKIESIPAIAIALDKLKVVPQWLHRLHHLGIELVLMRPVEDSDSKLRPTDQTYVLGSGMYIFKINQEIRETHCNRSP